MFIIDWLTANIAGISAAFAAGYAFALAVVKLTPTKKDDEVLAAIHDKVTELGKVVPLAMGALPIVKAALSTPAPAAAAEKPKA